MRCSHEQYTAVRAFFRRDVDGMRRIRKRSCFATLVVQSALESPHESLNFENITRMHSLSVRKSPTNQ